MRKLIWLILSAAFPLLADTSATNHYDILKDSTWFAISGGFANAMTPEGQAMSAILKQTNAAATFQKLLHEKAPAPQLYGLLGLHLLNAPEFKTTLPRLLDRKTKVRVLMGCIVGEQEVGTVARQIQANQWNIRDVPAPQPKQDL